MIMILEECDNFVKLKIEIADYLKNKLNEKSLQLVLLCPFEDSEK